MLFITKNLNGGGSLVWCWPMITFQPSSSAHLFTSMRKNATGKKKKSTLLLLYQGQVFCEALDLSNQTKLSVLTSNRHPPDFSLALKGALIFPLTTQRYDQRQAYYFIGCDLWEHVTQKCGFSGYMWSLNKPAPAWLALHFKPGHQFIRLYEFETAGGYSSTCTCPWCWHQADWYRYIYIYLVECPQFLISYAFHEDLNHFSLFLHQKDQREKGKHNICSITIKINKMLRLRKHFHVKEWASIWFWAQWSWRQSEI